MDSVYIFQAENYNNVFNEALKIGRAQEEEYLNTKKEKVSWKFKEIVSLDEMQKPLNGSEVYS